MLFLNWKNTQKLFVNVGLNIVSKKNNEGRSVITGLAANAAIQDKIYELGMTIFIISKKEMKGIMEIVKYLEESGLLSKGISKQLKMKQKNKKVNFFAW